MAGKKPAGENSKKAAGNAKKAEAAAQKQAVENAKKAKVEDEEWSKGAKSNAKKEAADAKRLADAAKKAEKDALLAAEESTARATPKGSNAKTAQKKAKGLDLSQLDTPSTSSSDHQTKAAALNATGIDNALDALSLTSANPSDKIERHPERRFKAAYAAFEARRLPELEDEMKGLRRQQRIEIVRKEFEKSEENPFNQVTASFDTSKEELKELKAREREKIERRLVEK